MKIIYTCMSVRHVPSLSSYLRLIYPKWKRLPIYEGTIIIIIIIDFCERYYNAFIYKTTFNIHGSVHPKSMSIIAQQDATICSLLYFCKLLYMFRVVTSLIIRSIYNCNYSIWHWSNRLCISNVSTIAEVSRDGLTSARCCKYSYMCSW
jgi:hypothetical protein